MAAPPLLKPRNIAVLNDHIWRAERQSLEAPWYAAYAFDYGSKICSANGNAYEAFGIQERFRIIYLGTKQETIPDFSLHLRRFGDPTEVILTVVEAKKTVDPKSPKFKEMFRAARMQLLQQLRLAFLSNDKLETLGAIASVGKYWNYREYERNTQDMFTDISDRDIDYDPSTGKEEREMDDAEDAEMSEDDDESSADEISICAADSIAMETDSQSSGSGDEELREEQLEKPLEFFEFEPDIDNPQFDFEAGVGNSFIFTLGGACSDSAIETIRCRNFMRYRGIWEGAPQVSTQ
ncbi:hypothetical protein C8R47DRAFT_1083194 [Mycena vitilis]|nr:hypothetical protein C8R47DRAFT_1083194 [Mycena vitilis]